ncbi:MAG: ABC transporter permease [Deltaproteobacteria bacterium]|nr:ABC transporter permease [Deltaproteobacteria bacterium]
MSLALLARRNIRRNTVRTALTMVALAIAVVAFVAIRTVLTAWSVAADFAAKDRLATRHKMSFVISMPKHYADTVREVPGIQAATWMNWFGARDPRRPDSFFATIAVDTRTFLDVYDEVMLPEDQKTAWLETRNGAIVGEVLAKELGVQPGDRVTLQGTIFPGSWEFAVSGIYVPTRQTIDRMSLFFHWDYLNDSIEEARRDQIGWIVSRVDDPTAGTRISQEVDRIFDEREVPTLTQSERDLNLSFMGMVSGILKALDIVSIVIMLIMLMILGNTIAMGVRERTRENGVLRALGFSPGQIVVPIMGEAAAVGILSGLIGLVLAYPIVELGMGRWLEENMGAYFPYFRIDPVTAVTAVLLCGLLGVLASIPPAWGAARMKVTDALRQVG